MKMSVTRFGQTWVQTCNLRNFGQRRGNLEGVGDCGDALCGVGATAIIVKAAELIVRQIELRGEHMMEEELVKVEAQSELMRARVGGLESIPMLLKR